MNLAEYIKLCTRLEKYCIKVRMQPTLRESENLLSAFESCLYQEQEWGELSDDCEQVERKLIPRYKKTLAVFERLETLIDDIKRGEIKCPQSIESQLPWRLTNIYAPCAKLSRACISILDGLKNGNEPTDEEKNDAVMKCRERIRKLSAYQDAENGGLVSNFIWNRAIGGPLFQWLIDVGISEEKNNRVFWRIEDGTFMNSRGEPITKASLSASKSAKTL